MRRIGRFSVIPAICVLLAAFFFRKLWDYPLDLLDDLILVSKASVRTSAHIVTHAHMFDESPFYRPMIDLTTHVLTTAFRFDPRVLRLYEMTWTTVAGFLAFRLFRNLGLKPVARLAGVLYFLASPLLFSAASWWSDLGSLYLVNLTLATLLWIQSDSERAQTKEWFLPLLYGGMALLCKEAGLAILLSIGFYFAFRRAHRATIAVGASVLAYFFVRSRIFNGISVPLGFVGSSGFLSHFYDTSELNAKFGGCRFVFYAYNVFVAFLNVLTSQPKDGQFRDVNVFTVAFYLLSTALVIWGARETWRSRPAGRAMLIFGSALILFNCLASYNYVRIRNTPMAATVYAVGLAIGVNAFLAPRHQIRFIGALMICVLWTGVFWKKLVRMQAQSEERRQEYLLTALPQDPRIDPRIFEIARKSALQVSRN